MYKLILLLQYSHVICMADGQHNTFHDAVYYHGNNNNPHDLTSVRTVYSTFTTN